MRKILLAALCLAALLVVVPRAARPSAYTVEPCLKSKACVGLVEHFNFEEASDFARYGAFGSTLHEVAGFNLGNTAGKIGNAANFPGGSNEYLWSSTFVPNMGAHWSMAFWFRPTALPGAGLLSMPVARNSTNNVGSQVYVDEYGNLCLYVINREATNAATACTTVAINFTYFIAFGVGDPDDTPGALKVWISKDGGAKVETTLNFIPASGLSHLRVGQLPSSGKGAVGQHTFVGWIDEFSIFGRSIGATDITLLWNGGSGRTYPWATD